MDLPPSNGLRQMSLGVLTWFKPILQLFLHVFIYQPLYNNFCIRVYIYTGKQGKLAKLQPMSKAIYPHYMLVNNKVQQLAEFVDHLSNKQAPINILLAEKFCIPGRKLSLQNIDEYISRHLQKPAFWRNKQCHPRSAVLTHL